MTNTEILNALEEKCGRYTKVDFWLEDDGFSTGCDDWPTEDIYFDRKFEMISLIEDKTKFMIDLQEQKCEIDKNVKDSLLFHTLNKEGEAEKIYMFDFS